MKFNIGDNVTLLEDYWPFKKGETTTVVARCSCGCPDGVEVSMPGSSQLRTLTEDKLISTLPSGSYNISVCQALNDLYREAWAETAKSLMVEGMPLSHLCEENRKTYDSGWSRYDYCSVCDKKLDEIELDRT